MRVLQSSDKGQDIMMCRMNVAESRIVLLDTPALRDHVASA